MYPEPWPGGEWRPRDVVEYERIAAESLVKLLDRQRRAFVENYGRWRSDAVAAGQAGGPFA